MNKFRTLTFGAICVLMAMIAGASEEYRSLYVNMKDGSKCGINISSELICQYKDEYTLTFARYEASDYGQELVDVFTVSYDNLKSITMDKDISGVENVEVDLTVTPDVKNGIISFKDFSSPITVSVYSIDGKVIVTRSFSEEGLIDLKQFGEGIYLVKINEITYKILVK